MEPAYDHQQDWPKRKLLKRRALARQSRRERIQEASDQRFRKGYRLWAHRRGER